MKNIHLLLIILLKTALISHLAISQVTININSGNPNFPFPQFKSYQGAPNTLANLNPVGVPHAELEQRTRDAYKILSNNMTYNINDNGVYGPVTINGIQYIMPNQGNGSDIDHCTCVEGDGYYLLAAAYMADKSTFDGYFMWMHDRQFQKTRRYIDGVVNSPTYAYSPGISGAGSAGGSTNVRGGALTGNSAADGDVDVALALLVAWKQWGNTGFITTDPNTGLPIYYRDEAIKYIKTLTDTLKYAPSLPIHKYISGIIGLDGYMKNGDSWAEITNWATGGTYMGLDPSQAGSQFSYVDYHAPAYFRTFADMLTAEGESPWCIEQYRRAEASCDWVMGQAYNQGRIPWIGQVTVAGAACTFSNFNIGGEDFRYGWRTIMNHMWNGAPTRTWNPITHTYAAGTNSYQLDMATRFASFLKNPENAPFNSACATFNGLDYGGTSDVRWTHDMFGGAGGGYRLNFIHGTGSPAAVVSGDHDLMSQMFRQCVIEWDQYDASGSTAGSQQYLNSKPRYFHEWFRMLGMLVLTGNMHDPLDMDPSLANMKVYKHVNKTYAYEGDTLEYTIAWRNYAKATANNVVITDNIGSGLQIISSDRGYSISGNTVTWTIGTVTGFTTGNLNATRDSLKFKVIVKSGAPSRICNVATITCSNGTGWTSNEYPNRITDVMERNCVDILTDKPLTLTITPQASSVCVGNIIEYTIVVKNKSVAFLNGGRQGVRIATANDGLSINSNILTLKYRTYHGAHEPLINYKNYRVSYYMLKPGPPTWIVSTTINEGCTTAPVPSQQVLPVGASWNHRFIIKFPNQQATITPMLYARYQSGRYIHEGALEPQRLVFQINAAGNPNFNWTTDWSSEAAINGGDGTPYFPIANDWTDPLLPNQPVLKYHPNSCGNNVTTTSTRQLVEEWDGYIWRRIYGNAPISGRELYNVRVMDTLPANVVFASFTPGFPVGTVSGNRIVWPVIPELKIGDSVIYKFTVNVRDAAYHGCGTSPTPGNILMKAGANADKEPTVNVTNNSTVVTCICLPPQSSSMLKTADKATYNVGEAIVYTIEYTNNEGATYNKPSSMVAGDWNNRKATTTVNASAITTVPNNFSILTNNYAHGTNGTLTFTVDPEQYATFGITLRNNGDNLYTGDLNITFKYEYSSIVIKMWNGATQIGSTVTVAGPWTPPLGGTTTFNHKLELNGSELNVYVSDMVSPIATFTALPILTPGWVGIINGEPTGSADSHGTHIITIWNSHFDSAFDLQMTDPIPANITYASANNTTYNAVNYTGSNLSGTVTWNTIPGPILADDEITFMWNGTVASCPASLAITNIAYAKLYGITPDLSGIVDVACSGVAASVSWLYTKAIPIANGNMIQWATSNETYNAYFIIERSVDGKNFEPIYTIQANNNSTIINEYSYIDSEIYSGRLYYRIAQVDSENNLQRGEIVFVDVQSKLSVLAYPNPFSDKTVLKLSGEPSQITIYSVLGVSIIDIPVDGEDEIVIGNELPAGTYVVSVASKTEIVKIRIVKNE